MNPQQKNLCWLTGGKIIELGLAFCVGLAVARHIGAYQLGVLALCMLIVGLVQQIAQSGLWAPISRRANEPDWLEWEFACREILRNRSLTWFVVIAVLCVLPFSPIPHKVELFLTALNLVGNTVEPKTWAHTARFESKRNLVADRTAQVVAGVFQLVVIQTQGNPALFALAMPLLNWTRNLMIFWGKFWKVHPPTGNPEKVKIILQEMKGTRFAVVAQFINRNIPMMVTGSINPESAGLVSAASRVQQMAGMPSGLIQQNECPQIARNGKWRWTLAKTTGPAIVASITVLILAEPIVTLLFGNGFQSAVKPLQWLMIALPAGIAVNVLESALLYHRGKNGNEKLSLQKPAILSMMVATGIVTIQWLMTNPQNWQASTLIANTAGIFVAAQAWIHTFILSKSLILLEIKAQKEACTRMRQTPQKSPKRAEFLNR